MSAETTQTCGDGQAPNRQITAPGSQVDPSPTQPQPVASVPGGPPTMAKLAQTKPGGQLPPHVGYPPGKLHAFGSGVGVIVGVFEAEGVGVAVGVARQSPTPHASQQLVKGLAQPPRSAHLAALFRTRHLVPPFCGMQQATVPGRPHVERRAQRRTAPLQAGGS
jgi:hypothetical protein